MQAAYTVMPDAQRASDGSPPSSRNCLQGSKVRLTRHPGNVLGVPRENSNQGTHFHQPKGNAEGMFYKNSQCFRRFGARALGFRVVLLPLLLLLLRSKYQKTFSLVEYYTEYFQSTILPKVGGVKGEGRYAKSHFMLRYPFL